MCGYNYTKKHAAEIAANWLKELKRTTTFLWRPRKVRTSDGWYWGGSWAIVGADNEWHNIDKYVFFEKLGVNVSPSDCLSFGATLQKAGYKVHDEELAVTVVFVKKGGEI